MPCKITSVQLTVPAPKIVLNTGGSRKMVGFYSCNLLPPRVCNEQPFWRRTNFGNFQKWRTKFAKFAVFLRTIFVCSRIIHLMIRRSLFANFANNFVCCKPYYLPSLGGSCDRLQDMWTVEQAGQLIIILLWLSTSTINAHHLIWQLYSSSNNNIDYYIYISLVLLW